MLLLFLKGNTDVDLPKDFDKLSPRARPRVNSLSRFPGQTPGALSLPMDNTRASSMHNVNKAGVDDADAAVISAQRRTDLLFPDANANVRSSFHALPSRRDSEQRERSALGEKKSRSFRSSRQMAKTVDSADGSRDTVDGETAAAATRGSAYTCVALATPPRNHRRRLITPKARA